MTNLALLEMRNVTKGKNAVLLLQFIVKKRCEGHMKFYTPQNRLIARH